MCEKGPDNHCNNRQNDHYLSVDELANQFIYCWNKIETIILQDEGNCSFLAELFQLQHCIEESVQFLKKSQLLQQNAPQNKESSKIPSSSTIENDKVLNFIKDIIETPRVLGLDEIAGLWEIKITLKTLVILPRTQPQLFAHHKASNSVLLFGPPGTGKTRLVHALAYEAKAILYSVTVSDILTPLVGQSEKNIQILFQYIRNSNKFSILFIDELDGFCKKRTDSEQDYSRRIKTELMCQISEIADNRNMFLICATNCPWDIDTAFLRRFQKRIYTPLPNSDERLALFTLFTKHIPLSMDNHIWKDIIDKTEGFSGSDVYSLVQHALNLPILELHDTKIWNVSPDGFYKPFSLGEDLNQDNIVGSELNGLPPCSVIARNVEPLDILNALDNVCLTISKADIKRYELFITN